MPNRNEEAYIDIIKSSISDYDQRIADLSQAIDSLDEVTKSERVMLKTFEKERDRLKEELDKVQTEGLQSNVILDDLSDKFDKIDIDTNEIHDQLSELHDIRDKVTTKFAGKIVDSKINRLQRRLDSLNNKTIMVGAVQQVILKSTHQKNMLINHFKSMYEAKQEVKQEDLEDKIQDFDTRIKSNELVMNDVLKPDDSIVDSIHTKILNFQNNYYIRKEEKAIDTFLKLVGKKEGLYFGANVDQNLPLKAVKAVASTFNMLRMNLSDKIQSHVMESSDMKKAM